MIPFTIKYRPKKISEIVNQKKGVEEIVRFLKNFGKGKKAIIIYGPPGIGKTASVYAIANELNYEIVTLDSSEIRNKKVIENVVKQGSLSGSIFGMKKLIFIDEVDNFQSTDYGGISALASAIKETKVPIVMTANDAYNPKIREIRNESKLIQFQRIPKNLIKKHLMLIAKKERIKIDEIKLNEISEKSEGDLRAALNDLYSIAFESNGTLSYRMTVKDVFNVLAHIFKSVDPKYAISQLQGLDLDQDTLFEWIVENVDKEYDAKEYKKAMTYLSISDMFMGRAKKKQYYALNYYAQLIGIGGVVISKKEPHRKFTRYQPPQKIMYLYKTKVEREKEKQKLKKLAEELHCSTSKIKTEYLPFMKFLDSKN